ncbi:MAG: hypothetical protein ACE3NC_00925 [Candidatus Wallacebacter cryptica]|jgi:hypothetical protein|nr:hypothetical protein [Bacillota bacterium]
MKKLNISWEGVGDTTGYLFSFAKCLSAAVRHSPYHELAEDIVASSGFAFRMWVDPELCPSATSMWSFKQQKPWVESGGLSCQYVERLWNQDDIAEERRLAAVELVKSSIDMGIAVIGWDIGLPEWGLIIGYDDQLQKLAVLDVAGRGGQMDYNELGKREIPILSVLAVTGRNHKSQDETIADTLKLAKTHLNGNDWCPNPSGLAAYPALIKHFEADFNPDLSWNMEYYLGTYAALKHYAWRFFDKYGLKDLAGLYKTGFECWQRAFETKAKTDLTEAVSRQEIVELLKTAEECEREAARLMD